MEVLAHFRLHGVRFELNPNQALRAIGVLTEKLRTEIKAQKNSIVYALQWQEFEALLAIVAPAYNTPAHEVDWAREAARGDLEAALVSYREMAAQAVKT
jgi:hypothetical protein